jgi:TRAP-type mannitol/chloroaromatic compound transport system permease small subunit
VFFWAAANYAWRSILVGETAGSAWDPPVYPIKMALAIGVALLLLQGMAKFIRDLHLAIKGCEL